MSQPNKPAKKPMTEVEALARIEKVLNQLNVDQRKKVLAFLAA